MTVDSRPSPIRLLLLLLVSFVVSPITAASGQDPEGSFVVAAAGDISCPAELTSAHHGEFQDFDIPTSSLRCQGGQVADLMLSADPQIVLALGDLIQDQPSVTKAYDDFHDAWGNLGQRIMPTIGNHDYIRRSDGKKRPSGYFDYWEAQGAPRWKTGTRNKGWSSWNAGSWHMINLNSNCRLVDCTFSGPQMRWLLRDLKANRKSDGPKCILAYFHHPLFSGGIRAGRSGDDTLLVNAWELLYRFRADLVVTGHQHFYQRFQPLDPDGRPDPTGITQFITGTGGASTFPVTEEGAEPAAHSESAERRMGATFFELGPSSYAWEFRSIRGRTFDRAGEPVPCRKAGAGTERRVPRLERYVAHMKRVSKLTTKKRRLSTRLRKARRSGAPRARVRKLRKRLRETERRHAERREARLYPPARPGT